MAYQQFKLQSINRDVPPYDVPPNQWTDGRNVYNRDFLIARALGYTSVYDTAVFPPLYLENSEYDGTNRWIYGAATGVGATDGDTHADITPASFAGSPDANDYTTTILNGLPCLNNSFGPPVYWDRVLSNPMLDLPGWPAGTTCKALRAFKFHLFALAIDDAAGSRPDQLYWSAGADPGNVPATWDPQPDNDAGDTTLSETDGEIVDAIAYRNKLFIFKQHSTYVASYVGGLQVYTFDLLFPRTGLLARDCAAISRNKLYMMTDGDIIVTDGFNTRSILTARMRRFVFESIDLENFKTAFTIADVNNSDIWFCFPEKNQTRCTKAVVWNIDNEQVTLRDLPNVSHGSTGIVDQTDDSSWDADSEAWDAATLIWNATLFSPIDDSILMTNPDDADPTKYILRMNFGDTNDGAIIPATLTRSTLDFGNEDRLKTIYKVRPRIIANTNVNISLRVGTQDSPQSPISWSQLQTIDFSQTQEFEFDITGRFISFEFSTNDTALWIMSGFDVLHRLGGRY